ncbi:MAG: magnesium transporter MgtE [Candidatus Nephthysia bennettiae]|uniref:Magnesium transporter n=1 Tax=Candidatus Nephthysia bennettiae TaxID=3127016 RepID=A0A934K562_9BACT|nr:magnesium transporter [Candidatus Dormibacteraeota bacterium]MBJ7612370.1 magnesium transporter [Candidatus Dormibacteraeota bacterium]PZR90908.1 MAG: magnesium transporter MgtE [Candidatus Dormibacteraeota bacterium]
MLFLTEILGAEVIDVRQRRAGTVRDVTVRVQEPYPVVTGLVTSRRKELVIPWSSVRSFAAATREVALRSSREEVERNQADPGDVWLARDVLDKQVVDTDGRRVVRVNDLQLAESGGAMLLVGADIGFRGILRRLGIEKIAKSLARVFGRDLPMVLVSWDVVDAIAPGAGAAGTPTGTPAGDDAVRLRISGSRIAKLHPADIADIVEELGAKERRAVFETLTEEMAADTLEEMELEDQVSVIEHMDAERASDILEEMPPDEVADILTELPEDRAQQILGLMEKEGAEDVQELLAYEEDTAGGLMTTEYVAVPETLTAQECIETLRRMEPDAESIYYVFVVDPEEHLQGVLSLRDLIVAPPDKPIGEIMNRDVVTVRLEDGQKEVAAVLSKYNLLAVPVVDDEFRLQGVVTVDDALDAVLPESVKRKLPRVF